IKPIGAGEGRPITIADAFLALHCAWTNPVAIILQTTGDPVNRARVVQRDAVEFASWDPIQMFPVLSAGVALINATIVSDNQTQRDRRFRWLVLALGFRRFRRRRTSILNSQRVHIRMQFVRKILAESFSAIIRNEKCEA